MLLHTYVFYYVYSYPIVPTYSPLSSTKYVLNPPFSNMPPCFFCFFFRILSRRGAFTSNHLDCYGSSLKTSPHTTGTDWDPVLLVSGDITTIYRFLRILYVFCTMKSLYTVCTHFDWVKTCMKRASIAQGSPVPKLMPFSTISSCGAPTKGILTWYFRS